MVRLIGVKPQHSIYCLKKLCFEYSEYLIYFERDEYSADFSAVFKKDNVVIGLYSSGDDEGAVSHNLYQLDAYLHQARQKAYTTIFYKYANSVRTIKLVAFPACAKSAKRASASVLFA